ncbi:unnamed protein product [Agarophyton chilense]
MGGPRGSGRIELGELEKSKGYGVIMLDASGVGEAGKVILSGMPDRIDGGGVSSRFEPPLASEATGIMLASRVPVTEDG